MDNGPFSDGRKCTTGVVKAGDRGSPFPALACRLGMSHESVPYRANFNGHKKRRQRRRELLPLPALLMKGLHGTVREAIPFRTPFLPILRARRMAGFPCVKPFDPSIRPPKSRRGQNGAPCLRGSAVSHLRVKAADGFLRRSALTMSDGRTTTGESAGYCKDPEKTVVNRGRNR